MTIKFDIEKQKMILEEELNKWESTLQNPKRQVFLRNQIKFLDWELTQKK